jgi:hypothetical protein
MAFKRYVLSTGRKLRQTCKHLLISILCSLNPGLVKYPVILIWLLQRYKLNSISSDLTFGHLVALNCLSNMFFIFLSRFVSILVVNMDFYIPLYSSLEI